MADRRAALVLAVSLLGVCLAGVVASWPMVRSVIVVAGGLVSARLTVLAWRHARLASALRRGSVGGDCHGIHVRWRVWHAGVAVAGLRRPEIYCHPRLRGSLTPRELTAMLLHERHHQLRRDPLRLLLLAVVAPVAKLVPAGRAWLARRAAAVEVAADRFALEHGAARCDLAGALLKVDASAPAPAAGFGVATELRLRALLGEEPDLSTTHALAGLAGVFAVVTLGCAAAMLHHVVGSGGAIGCALVGC
ncbi:MAG: hypothetical protein KY469_19885 [Actinobacteria bacterium]|nr:hypothetical protein [Actinomycetota bacterium]